MDEFPEFMKRPANRIAASSQTTAGVEGYVFEGVDGSQMAFWTCRETAPCAPHVHDFDEYMVVVQGCYTLIIDEKRVPVQAGEEYFIPKDSGMPENPRQAPGPSTLSAGDVPRGLIYKACLF
jgi:ethanolamine utilization protein EutQ (cupin superfamily)